MGVSNCERLYDSWVCDYMIVEYVDLLKSSYIDSFLCYDKLQWPQWLRLEFVGSQWSLWFILDIVDRLLLEHKKSYDNIYMLLL